MNRNNGVQGGRISCPESDGNYTYILRCSDDSLYTGWTVNLKRRLSAHNAGTGSRYTKTRLPVELVYYEEYTERREAMSREWHIKQLERREKLALIESWNPIEIDRNSNDVL